MLELRDASSSSDYNLVIQKHPDFRLFATQNPATGFFKRKREPLSSSFLDRFTPLVFKELPNSEWEEIVMRKLMSGTGIDSSDAASWAHDMVMCHCAIRDLVSSPKFSESTSYAQVSIRELLKWVSHIRWYSSGWIEHRQNRCAILGFEAWANYGARFRREGRKAIQLLLQDKMKWNVSSLVSPGITTWVLRESGPSTLLDLDGVITDCPIKVSLFVLLHIGALSTDL